MTKYQPSQFESQIRELWEKENTFATSEPAGSKKKMYTLSMFPYPSGAGLHVGHVRIYTGTDVLARYFRLKGNAVLHPMGWDAFGLPAENAAIKAKKNPMDMVPGNIATFKRQMQTLGLSYDWRREFATTDPEYYRYTQWLFIQFFKMGLLYKKNTPINFCPACKTGLAEEEVLPNGTHERCGNLIIKKDLPQWIFRITTYAERLLSDLKGLDWPDGILEMQKNWIGKKEGINITYKVTDSPDAGKGTGLIDVITCFTTRPDTNFGATFIVLAPEHPFVSKLLEGTVKTDEAKLNEIKAYIKKAVSKSEMEREAEGRKKTGVFTGLYAINSLNGKHMPVWVSDFVLMNFGTGAVVGVPAHDMRDFQFAKEYGIEIKRVVVGKDKDTGPVTEAGQVQEEEGVMMNSQFLDGLDIHEATGKIMQYMEEKGYGKKVVSYHLRDWIFSRQRYWGEPIPMVHCESCAKKGISWWLTDEGKSFQKKHHTISKVDQTIEKEMQGWFPIVEQELPLKLPYVKSYEPTDTGESPLAQVKEWANGVCPECGLPARRETDTMPNWAGSCWYFLKFASPDRKNDVFTPWNKDDMDRWMPVDWYLGGAEHAVLHLLYARFWVKALQDLGLLNFPEPFLRLRNVGMVLAEDHRKMSKSFGNVINPDDVAGEFGADTLRVYEMFMAPFNMEISWSLKALQGSFRFLNRIWQIYHNSDKINGRESDKEVRALLVLLQKTVRKVGDDIALTKFNTAIASMMEFLNAWEKGGAGLPYSEAKKFLQILSPFAPFLAEKLWRDVFKEKESVCISAWPDVNVERDDNAFMQLPVQVNGKVRAVLTLSSKLTPKEIEDRALQEDKVKKFIGEKKYRAIYVPGKILNVVTSD